MKVTVTLKEKFKNAIPIQEGLFEWPAEEAHLIASKCTGCGELTFPKRSFCNSAVCPKGPIEEVLLSDKGKLYSHTIMHYGLPAPFDKMHTEIPYGLGLVELPEGIIILGLLTSADPEELKIGRDMQVIIDKLYVNDEGKDVITYKFKPV